ncbi:MAG: hypothetical protein P4L93_00530 [Coriobacteriia bacterium]|nr:hypothetical protein [Coriobacteriia bacterium]
MRTSVWIAVLVVVVMLLAGCSAKTASTTGPPQVASSELSVLGASTRVSSTATSKQSTQTAAPNPATAEGIPASLGVQVSSAYGATPVTQAKALEIAATRKPLGGRDPAAVHVLFARSGGKNPPIDAWMVTFHGGQLPGADGSATSNVGSVTIFVDSSSGAVADTIAYEPVAK